MTSNSDLQTRWNELYRTTLPRLAKARDPVQKHWPVYLDHCFGRIILDNAVGVTQQWNKVIKSPAWRNMTERQLEDAIMLGESIAVGEANLDELNQRSLDLRDKNAPAAKRAPKRKAEDTNDEADKKHKTSPPASVKRTTNPKETGSISSYFMLSPKSEKPNEDERGREISSPEVKDSAENQRKNPITGDTYANDDPLSLIEKSDLTAFRKQILSVLCQVPRGQWTSYAAMSDHVTATSHKTCARAVGNAMRNNPFAPVVPCHRVLAHDGKIGGFGGHWGEEGKYAKKKRDMLREEGVKFDGSGKVVGGPFRGFK